MQTPEAAISRVALALECINRLHTTVTQQAIIIMRCGSRWWRWIRWEWHMRQSGGGSCRPRSKGIRICIAEAIKKVNCASEIIGTPVFDHVVRFRKLLLVLW